MELLFIEECLCLKDAGCGIANPRFGLIFFQTDTDTDAGNCSIEPSLDDGEVVVQPGRSAEKMSMIQ